MGNTTKATLFFDGGGFFLVTDKAKSPVDTSAALSMKAGYDLVLDDSLLFYTFMEFPHASKRKLDLFVQNWLSAGFPAEFTKLFGYLKKGDKLLISLFKPDFLENPTVKKIMDRAGRVTSPMAIRYGASSDFTHTYAQTTITVEDDKVSHAEFDGTASKKSYAVTADSALTLPFSGKKQITLGSYKLPVAIVIICYALFVTGSYMRLNYHKNRLAAAEQMLNSVYERAGVADSPDPFGMLMFKAGKNGGAETFKNMRILETISRAQSERITAVSVEIKNGLVTYEGLAGDYAFIEDFKKQLKKETGREINITDTKKTEKGISFVVRF